MSEIEYFVENLEEMNYHKGINWLIDKYQVRKKKQNRDYLAIQHYIVYLIKINTTKSLSEIARYFRRDHCFALNAKNLIQQRIETKDKLTLSVIDQMKQDVEQVNWKL